MGNERKKNQKEYLDEQSRVVKDVHEHDDYIEKITELKKATNKISDKSIRAQTSKNLDRLEKRVEFTGVDKKVEEIFEQLQSMIKKYTPQNIR